MVRLYVGGLDADVTEELLAGRFKSFGTVTSCEVARNKPGSTVGASDGCRGFAHVDLEPHSEQALHRCLSTVSTWSYTSHVYVLHLWPIYAASI